MKPEYCKECNFCHKQHSFDGFSFSGCTHKPYKGKWVIEIKQCPKDHPTEKGGGE